MTDDEVDGLRARTTRSDRLDEEGRNDDADDGEEERVYASVEDVVLRQAADDDVEQLRRQTRRDRRVEVDEEDEEVSLMPVEEAGLDDATLDAVDDPYCGNCAAVTFRKRDGEPTPICDVHDCPTRLESGMVCSEYDPQGL